MIAIRQCHLYKVAIVLFILVFSIVLYFGGLFDRNPNTSNTNVQSLLKNHLLRPPLHRHPIAAKQSLESTHTPVPETIQTSTASIIYAITATVSPSASSRSIQCHISDLMGETDTIRDDYNAEEFLSFQEWASTIR